MATEKLECPVALRTLPAYLGGRLDGTPEALEFEEHIRQCEECRDLVSDRRKALQVLIAAADRASEEPAAKPAKEGSKKRSAWPSVAQFKPVFYSVGLAAALIGVSYVVGPKLDLFGETLADSTATAGASGPPAEAEGSSEGASADATSEEVLETAAAVSAAEDEAPTLAPDGEETVETSTGESGRPGPTVKRAPTTTAAPKRTQTAKPQASVRVEVFDENGRKIGESVIPK
ncbi:MAG: zf-HC2 domain-containing protein [Armatimonadetes bacterium]|nr:zf-HC2 domain-containing protein [Armatimonadota bacterium]